MPGLIRLSWIISRWWVVPLCLLGFAWSGDPLAWAQATVVIDEDFSDDDGGCSWTDNFGCVPQNTSKAGEWLLSGHVVTGGNADDDWRPLVQSNVGQPAGGSGAPSLDYFASLNRTGSDTGQVGVFNMDGIIKFQTAAGVDFPAVTGNKIVGSFRVYTQSGSFGFGFTDDIAELQAFQATMPDWNAGSSPIMMPTPYTTGNWEVPASNPNYDPAYRGFSRNVTGHISLNSGANQVYTNAPIDMNDDGVVDFGRGAPKTDPNNPVGRLNSSTPSQIRFEYTVGNSDYDLLQIDQGSGFEDIVQCNSAACQDSGGAPTVPNPGGPMPVGHVLSSIEGMFITGGNYQLTEVWADDFLVEVVADPTVISWTKSEGGDWNESANWYPLAVPSPNDKVTFGSSAQGGTVFLDDDVSIKKMTFDSPQTYAVSGTGRLTLEGIPGSAEIEVADGPQGSHQLQVDRIILGTNTNINTGAAAQIDINSELELNSRTLTIESGNVHLNNTTENSGTGTVFNYGTIGGGGTVNGNFINLGMITVEFLDESTPNGLNVTGSAFLNGTLDVVGDVTPSAGSFEVFTAGSIGGTPELSLTPAADEFFDIVITGSSVLLVPSSGSLPGDYNENGEVDAADYTVFRDGLFTSASLPNDNNLGTPIRKEHYDLWKASFGNTASSTAAGVPEPATFGLLLWLFGLVVFYRVRWAW